ncbi:YbjN domain-containing protein [Gemmatimonadota bacterium]
MALTMERLESLVKAEGLKYFRDPDRDALMLGATGLNGSYQFLILLELGGEFIQFRTMRYHSCPLSHPQVDAVLRVLGDLNYRLRFLKFGWDPSDGEIVAYGDMWIIDGDLTQAQFGRMIKAYMTVMDLNYARINQTVETGEDPGEVDPADAVRRASGAGLPPALQEAVDELKKRLAQGREGGEAGGDIDVL